MDVQHFEAQDRGCQYFGNCCTILAFSCSAVSCFVSSHKG